MSSDTKAPREPIYVVAKYDYNPSSEQELALRKSERLRLLDDSKQWWKVENARYQSGFVPSNYVKKEKPSLLNSLKRHVKRKSSEKKITHISAPIPPAQNHLNGDHPTGIPNKPFTALVKFAYDPVRSDELQLRKGETILVVEKSHDGWWKGLCKATGAAGWFPSNYVKESPVVITEADSDSRKSDQRNGSVSPNHYEGSVQALYSYSANSPEELSFERDELLTIFDAPTDGTNWLRARNAHGATGVIPKNYVQLLQDNSPRRSKENGVHHHGEENVPEELAEDFNGLHLNGETRHSDPKDDFIDRVSLRNKPWYFGRMSRQDCDNLLNNYGQDGDFLVRDSETGNKADFSVSLKASPRNKHFRVSVNSVEGHLTIGQRRFNSLDEMISHYEKYAICTNSDGKKLTLLRPLQAPRSLS